MSSRIDTHDCQSAPVFELAGVSAFPPDYQTAPGEPARLLHNISLEIPAGRLVLLTGPNGSGKTILLRILTGLHTAWEGAVSYRGQPLRSSLREIRRRTGLLFQNPLHQLVERTVLDDVILSLRYRGIRRATAIEMVQPLIHDLALQDLLQRDPYSLSTGEQRRTVIAGLLAGGADTLLLDEPFTGLDYPGANELVRHLVQLRERGCSLVICTHDLIKIIQHTDHCLVLQNGQMQYSGDTNGLMELQRSDPDALQLEPIIPERFGSYH
ncbi:energy-coupling factor ABC transporter ATP-binding protein [Spirochaeta africana]|uniref:ABC-type cobalt transport system, ATPase component n=1 Tax=Spirochaeta africana (strain ATCC 700263 / DSM 8902 / Z-7692) TaxID=889378 RepID=H9UHS5_SPIAZ|nr:ABC transporter ATP-binding protein [Spirochaeta africana]AFG37068.1 ABC-type cobalt transport system, ATPase component [Spirochaeta africana DSM 8902]